MRHAATAFGLAAFLFAGTAAAAPGPTTLTPADASAHQTSFHTGGPPDLSVVWVARLTVDGHPLDVTSLNVTRLGAAGKAESLVRFTEDRHALEFLSLDPKDGSGKTLLVKLDKVPHNFTFPVLTDGALKPVKVTVNSVVHKP